jgi:hypothetical protein
VMMMQIPATDNFCFENTPLRIVAGPIACEVEHKRVQVQGSLPPVRVLLGMSGMSGMSGMPMNSYTTPSLTATKVIAGEQKKFDVHEPMGISDLPDIPDIPRRSLVVAEEEIVGEQKAQVRHVCVCVCVCVCECVCVCVCV